MSEAERDRLEALYEERIQLSKAALQEAMVAAATELAAMREQVRFCLYMYIYIFGI